VIRRPANTKIVLATVQPWERIAGPVKLRKVEFVVSWKEVAVVLIVLLSEMAAVRWGWWRPRFHARWWRDRTIVARRTPRSVAVGGL
jgi:hypothetical protein